MFEPGDHELFKNNINQNIVKIFIDLKCEDLEGKNNSPTKAIACFNEPGILTRATFGNFSMPYNLRIRITERLKNLIKL